MNLTRGGWLILLTVIAAFLLTLARAPVGSPEWLGWLRPGWIVLVVYFWAMEVPHRIGLISTWIMGFFVDIVFADPLGLNGIVLTTITFFTWRFHERLRMYAVLQQAWVAAAMVLFSEGARRLAHDQAQAWLPVTVLPAITSMFVWPAVYLLLGKLTQRFRVE